MILDTSFLVDVLRGDESAREWEATLDESGFGVVTAITVMELWEGIHLADATEPERDAVERLLSGLHHADLDRPAAMWAGETSASLTREGRRIEVEDVMIGAIARQRDEPVLTRNAEDFERLPGVSVERY